MPIWIDVGDGTVIVPPPVVPPQPQPPAPAPPAVATVPPPPLLPPAVPPPPPPAAAPPPTPSTQAQPIPQPGQVLIDVGDGTVIPAPPVVPSPPTPGGVPSAPSDGYPAADGGDWPDPDGGDGDYTDADLAAIVQEADDVDAGRIQLLSVNHPPPGSIGQGPYEGTHGKAYNIAGGSDNWESENAVDIWLYPGTHVLAVEDGTVSPGGWGYGLSTRGGRFAGWRVHLVASNGRVFYYTHMAGLNVLKGQPVKKGHTLGFSGVANGTPHLHFAVNPPFDPHAWAKATYDLKARTNLGQNPVTGDFPASPADVNAQWRDLIDVFGKKVPAIHTRAAAVDDRIRAVLK